MLENGYGEHNIQGIGDKHIPLIHNVMNTDVVVAISDKSTDELDALFNTDEGRAFLADRKGVPADVIDALEHFGFSSIANVLAAIKTVEAARPRSGRRRHHRRHRRCGAVPERAGQADQSVATAGSSRRLMRRRRSANISPPSPPST